MKNLPAIIENEVRALKLDPAKVNVILPTQTFATILGEYDRLVVEVVKIDADPQAKEVYDLPGGKAFTKVGLQKFEAGLGLYWVPEYTGTVFDDKTKSRAKATAVLRIASGETRQFSDEKTVDLDAIKERELIKCEKSALQGNPHKVTKWGKSKSGKSYPEEFEAWKSDEEKEKWISLNVREAVSSYRLFKNERAVTGAKERVIREILALKPVYTIEELSLPFAFPRIILDSEKMLSSPDLREAAILRMVGASSTIYGPQNGESNIKNVIPPLTELPEIPETATTNSALPESAEPDIFELEQEPAEQPPNTIEVKKIEMETWLNSGQIKNPNNIQGVKKLIATPDVTAEECDRILAALQKTYGGAE